MTLCELKLFPFQINRWIEYKWHSIAIGNYGIRFFICLFQSLFYLSIDRLYVKSMYWPKIRLNNITHNPTQEQSQRLTWAQQPFFSSVSVSMVYLKKTFSSRYKMCVCDLKLLHWHGCLFQYELLIYDKFLTLWIANFRITYITII